MACTKKSSKTLQVSSAQRSEQVAALPSATQTDSAFLNLSDKEKVLYLMAALEGLAYNTWSPDVLYLSMMQTQLRLEKVGRPSEEVADVLNELMESIYKRGGKNMISHMFR